ncbi:MAG TPA: carboxypeptidase-like regulatory domain-containing protein [Acidobacteriaceae bacterium]
MQVRSASRALCLTIALAGCAFLLHAQDEHRGRKYTPPPAVAHITVVVTRGLNNKPVEGAAIIFHPEHNGKDQGNLEVKTNEEGRAIIDIIPIGDTVRLQVFKPGFQTFGADYDINSATLDIPVKLKAPARQSSTYDKQPDAAKPDETAKPQ